MSSRTVFLYVVLPHIAYLFCVFTLGKLSINVYSFSFLGSLMTIYAFVFIYALVTGIAFQIKENAIDKVIVDGLGYFSQILIISFGIYVLMLISKYLNSDPILHMAALVPGLLNLIILMFTCPAVAGTATYALISRIRN